MLRIWGVIAVVSLTLFAICSVNAQVKGKPKPPPKPKPMGGVPSASKCEANGLTQAEITELLSSHNKARSEQKLPPLVWDCKLANYAQQWANRGAFEHRADNPYGENMFVASNPAEPAGSAVKSWMNEKANWTNKTATCATGKVCTHYTQVVWNTTTQVGCGVLRNGPGKWKTLLVCNYNPAGNGGGPAY